MLYTRAWRCKPLNIRCSIEKTGYPSIPRESCRGWRRHPHSCQFHQISCQDLVNHGPLSSGEIFLPPHDVIQKWVLERRRVQLSVASLYRGLQEQTRIWEQAQDYPSNLFWFSPTSAIDGSFFPEHKTIRNFLTRLSPKSDHHDGEALVSVLLLTPVLFS